MKIELMDKLKITHTGITFVGITGFQGAGKTTLINQLKQESKERGISVETISSDLYHMFTRPQKREIFKRGKDTGKDTLDLILEAYAHNTQLMREHFLSVKRGKSIHAEGLYDNLLGERIAKLDVCLEKEPIIVIAEGVYILEDGLGTLLDRVIFVDANKDERLRRTIQRQESRPGAHKIDIEAYSAMDKANESWITPNLRKPYILVDNSDYNNPLIKEIN